MNTVLLEKGPCNVEASTTLPAAAAAFLAFAKAMAPLLVLGMADRERACAATRDQCAFATIRTNISIYQAILISGWCYTCLSRNTLINDAFKTHCETFVNRSLGARVCTTFYGNLNSFF